MASCKQGTCEAHVQSPLSRWNMVLGVFSHKIPLYPIFYLLKGDYTSKTVPRLENGLLEGGPAEVLRRQRIRGPFKGGYSGIYIGIYGDYTRVQRPK